MPGQTTEKAFETYVEEILLTKGGWKSGTNPEWDKDRALLPARIFSFHKNMQLGVWAEIPALHGRFSQPMLITAAVTGKIDVRTVKR